MAATASDAGIHEGNREGMREHGSGDEARCAARPGEALLSDKLLRWVDSRSAPLASADPHLANRVDWARIVPFLLMHVACLGVFWTGVSWTAVLVALALYLVRMFAITGFYHRYFSHRTFKTSRVGQFIFGVLGASAVQRGPIWWAAHHRHHHAHSDQPEDIHSPSQKGFWRSHMGWFLSRKGFNPDLKYVRDLLQFRELRWLDRFDIAVPALLGLCMFLLGRFLEKAAPHLGTSGGQMLTWGFFISTVL